MKNAMRVCWWDDSTIGHLVQKGPVFFVYDEAWLQRGLNLSPLALPFTDKAFNGSRGLDGLPGLIADCLPDGWGRKVARTEFALHKWGEPSALSLLAWRGRRGVGALHFLPPLEEASEKLEVIRAKTLARGAAEIERGEPSEILPRLAKGGTAGGAWPKALVIAYEDGTLKVGAPDGFGTPSLLKFDLSKDGHLARSEAAYAAMARAAGIRVAATSLIAESANSRRRHLLVSRFDIPAGNEKHRRIHFHSASGILHKSPDALDYADLYRAAIRLHLSPEDIAELTRRMLFNVLASNHDDHGKNHAFQLDETTGHWKLTPAYDLTYCENYLQRGTQVAGEVWPKLATMETLCMGAGIKPDLFQSLVHEVRHALHDWPTFAAQHDLPTLSREEVSTRLQRIDKEVCG